MKKFLHEIGVLVLIMAISFAGAIMAFLLTKNESKKLYITEDFKNEG